MKIGYFSASILPSKTANSVHVMNMCSALGTVFKDVTLYAFKNDVDDDVFNFYNVNSNFKIVYYKKKYKFVSRIFQILRSLKQYEFIYTRYTIVAFIATFFKNKQFFYEYHNTPSKKINKIFERKIIYNHKVFNVFITESLMKEYVKLYGKKIIDRSIVLSDCAKDPNIEITENSKKILECGYIGSFQKGKGIELVCEISTILSDVQFHIVGGTTEEINGLKKIYPNLNLKWYGYLKQEDAMLVLSEKIDIALLPNQPDVFVGNKNNINIGSFTSPMKLFEYMSHGKVIISSNIDVLKEILTPSNSMLVNYSDINEWCDAITYIQSNRVFYEELRINTYQIFKENFTWENRVNKINSIISKWN